MAEELRVPKLGMASAAVLLVEWKVGEGEWIEEGNPVLDIEAEKTDFEMEAIASGHVHILAEAGIEADVGTVVGLIAPTKAEYESLLGHTEATSTIAPPPRPSSESTVSRSGGERVVITPIARRLADEQGVDYTSITGSGPRGRIEKRDVEQVIGDDTPQTQAPQSTQAPADQQGVRKVKEVIRYSGMRKTIGENMVRSLAVNAPNTMSGDFDFTVMVKYRKHFLTQENKLGVRITYSDLLLQAVAKALREFPLLNSSLNDDTITVWDEINIGMAVALGDHGEHGLVVPVLRNVDEMSLVEISRATKSLGERARTRQLQASEMTGGTFTVTNFGSLGVSSYSTPIINPPESAILGLGRLQEKPIVRNGGIVVAPMLPYSLTHDHRVIDGAAAEAFLACLKRIVESTSPELNKLIPS